MEELKLQLAERMPGVISAMAEAGGFEDQAALFKAMEKGEVKSADIMERFAAVLAARARQGGALENAMKSASAEQGRFNNAFTAFVEIMGKSGLESGFARIFQSMAEFLQKNEKAAHSLGVAFDNFSIVFKGVLNGVTFGLDLLDKLADKLSLADGSLIALTLTSLMMLNPFTRILTVFSALMLIVEDLYVYSQGGDSLFGQWMSGLDSDTFKTLKDFFGDLTELGDETSIAVDKITTAFTRLVEYLGESGVGGAVFRTTVQMLSHMVGQLTTMVKMAGMVAEGDLLGAAKVGAERSLQNINAFTRNAAGAVDLVLPGTPLTSSMDYVNSLMSQSTPQGRELLMQQAQQQRMAAYEANRGSGADVPVINNTFTINGADNAEETARLVIKAIEESAEMAKKNMPVTGG